MTESTTQTRRRRWLRIAMVGFALVLLTLLTLGVVMAGKGRFDGMLGWTFLPVIWSGVTVGGLVLLVAALFLPERASWRGVVLILWAAIALTSPLFGIMFLLPWALLAVTLPLILWILIRMSRVAVA